MLYIPDRRCYSNSSSDMEPLAQGCQAKNLRIPDVSVNNLGSDVQKPHQRGPLLGLRVHFCSARPSSKHYLNGLDEMNITPIVRSTLQ